MKGKSYVQLSTLGGSPAALRPLRHTYYRFDGIFVYFREPSRHSWTLPWTPAPWFLAGPQELTMKWLKRCSKGLPLLAYRNVSGAGGYSAFHETGYVRGLGVVPLDPFPIVLIVAIAVSSRPSASTWFARLHLRFVLFCDDPQRASTLSDTHCHPHRCLDMPLPENTTISLHGHSRPEDALHSKPKQAIFLRMSAETLEALQASPLPQVQFTFGKRSVSSIPTARSPQLDLLPCRAFKWEILSFQRTQLLKMQSMMCTSVLLPRDRRTRHSSTTRRWLESSWCTATAPRR